MPYATLVDFAVFGLTSATLEGIDPSIQSRHLSAASAFIDSYLNEKFTLPLKSFGDDLVQKCCEIAAGTLLTIRGWNPEDPADRSIIDRSTDAKNWLNGIKEGEITPVVTDSSLIQGQPAGPNTLQMSTQGNVNQSPDDIVVSQQDGVGNLVTVGRPQSRGWR